MTTTSAREFNRDISAAKRAADHGPVVITDRGRAAYVPLSAPAYAALTDKPSIVDSLQMDSEIEFEPARLMSLPQAAEF